MAKQKVIVLGCGLVGATMARDLAADPDFEVSAADISRTNLGRLAGVKNLQPVEADLGQPERVKALVKGFDYVVGAMPSTLGFQTMRAVIESGKSYCDISFMIEDARELDAFAKEKGVTVVFDCGVAPGLANMVIGHCHADFDKTTDVVYYVGGLPKKRSWPFEYKAPFAPADVIEEYTRPARMIENGKVVTKPALSEPELLDFPIVGTLEGSNTDGLRSLLDTVPALNMREKTLRYPGHCELMRVLRETGFFGKQEIDVKGMRIRPLDLSSRLIFENWKLEEEEPEFTILRVVVEGQKQGRSLRRAFELFDEYDVATRTHSMARTTGYPNTAMLRSIARGEFRDAGVFAPEEVGRRPGMLHHITTELARRGVMLKEIESK